MSETSQKVRNTESLSAARDVDYISIVNESVVLPLHSNKEVFIAIIDDLVVESQERFLVKISAQDMDFGITEVMINILDNDGMYSVSQNKGSPN